MNEEEMVKKLMLVLESEKATVNETVKYLSLALGFVLFSNISEDKEEEGLLYTQTICEHIEKRVREGLDSRSRNKNE